MDNVNQLDAVLKSKMPLKTDSCKQEISTESLVVISKDEHMQDDEPPAIPPFQYGDCV